MSSWSSLWPARQGGSSPLHIWLLRLATLSAVLGGAVILTVALIVTVSVIMRNVGLRGITGDFELVQMSCVFAAGLFLPLCQLNKGHVMVDLFTNWLPEKTVARIDQFWTLVFALAWACLFLYMFRGMEEIRAYDDRSMLLKIPMWWGFVPSIIGAGLSSFIALAQTFFWRDDIVSPVGH
ncbi:TRAP transporter small permease [Hoeflea sp.]|uniref:TRAP transporter small permease n=1 Tax=Hoeflea sp. TaxID=1940281 RepID=UPI003748FE3C